MTVLEQRTMESVIEASNTVSQKTLRDEFAMSIIGSVILQYGEVRTQDDNEAVAENAYRIADAMLEARKK